jgi:hypothetical protein
MVATVAARIAAKTWGGRWTAAEGLEPRQPDSVGTQNPRFEDKHEQRTA